MKKKFSIILALLLFVSVAAYADDSDIQFREIQWYSTFADVSPVMAKEVQSGFEPTIYSDVSIDHLSGVRWKYTFDNPVAEGGVRLFCSDVPVAGYIANDADLSFMYPLGEDGRVARDDNAAEFYLAVYYIEDLADMKAVYNDLKAKLSKLYGEGVPETDDYMESVKWCDTQNNTAWLIINDEEDLVTLAYTAGDSDERLDALQAQITEEQIEKEDQAREENSDNTEGL
jgi:hypothetical protein